MVPEHHTVLKATRGTQENPSFYHSVPLTIVVLLDGICGIDGGGGVCGHRGGIGKSEDKERYENNIEGGGQGSVDDDEENESEKEKELESEKEKEDDHQHDDNGSPMGHELISTSQHDPIKTFSIDRVCHSDKLEIPSSRRTATPQKIQGKKTKEKIDGLFDISRRGYKACELFINLEDKTISEQYREQLCLVLFALLVILARDINEALAFEAIPPLGKQVMDYPDEVSHPKMFRGLDAKSNTNINEADLFNLSNDAVTHLVPIDAIDGLSVVTDDDILHQNNHLVVHPWIVPTEEESVMTSYITLGYVDTIADPMVELIKEELAGVIAIRRAVRQGYPNVETLHDQPTKADRGTSFGGVVGVGGRHADAATTRDNEHVENMLENTFFHPYIGPSQLFTLVFSLRMRRVQGQPG
ncbi:hypothetical protein FXO38_16465 [Capsicum annuum]|nr:hypothetical protein FXO37_29088 [Capsicum annuum]KAF3651694.1 hypothetical protein FXO38_16465 [Capsicum annuum]